MDRINELSLGKKLVLGAGVLLLIDTFLNWQEVTAFGFTGGQSAWHGFWGVLLGLMTVVLVVGMAVRAFANVQVPEGIPEGLISLVLGALILLFAVIKVISDSFVHWPAYAGIILAGVVTYGAWLVFQDSGDAFPAMPARAGGPSSTATPAPPPSTPPAAEPPAAPPEDEPSA
ncbi:MAG TPA: hypothetical protein VF094_05465 [Gaiellaceae bacterium]